jgi:hypothetical protein
MSNINTYTLEDKTDYLHMGLRVKYEYAQIGTTTKLSSYRAV